MEDISNNIKKKFFVVFWITISIFSSPLALWDEDSEYDLADKFLELVFTHKLISFAVFVGVFSIVWLIYSFIRWGKRVKLENREFEKEFDVFSEDQIEARKILTPSFMYRLVDFVNKVHKNRVYEILFVDNTFYIKLSFLKTNKLRNSFSYRIHNFMQFPIGENMKETVEPYVEFYLEIKNILSIVDDLKLFYYDKGEMTKEIIW